MTEQELLDRSLELAQSLEAAVGLATTRVEHVRVSSHADRARAIYRALEAASKPPASHGTGIQPPAP